MQIRLSQEIKESGLPKVALESTIISHGMPYPQNVETALEIEALVRTHGCTPATCAIIHGVPQVGLSTDEIAQLGKAGQSVTKVSRRDFPWVMSQKQHGATTVAGTMILAEKAGIRIFATGGVGGVHRGAETNFDISADLQELAKTSVAVVSAGAKSILDLSLTLEYLETMGVPVLGYQTQAFPSFYCRESGLSCDYAMPDAASIAAFLATKWQFELEGGVLVANPVPVEYALPYSEMENIIKAAIQDAQQFGINGKKLTPYLLGRIKELTGGNSLKTNIALVKNNAILACQIAKSLSQYGARVDH
jgi:pseudouridylate synthase